MKRYPLTPTCSLVMVQGDITEWTGDAIVNAANEWMLGGGGVDGAIHAAAGPGLRKLCAAVPEVRPGVRCQTGEARITSACGSLRARFVIHTVGPIYQNPGHSPGNNPERSAGLLASAYRSSLGLANQHALRSVAFPAISCGVYGYPLAEAAEVAVRTCRNHAGDLREITFVLYRQETWWTFTAEADRLLQEAA